MRALCFSMLTAAICLSWGTARAQTCTEMGGVCMEGCESGYQNIGAYDCFDSTCCAPLGEEGDPRIDEEICAEIGGVCAEGCEVGYRDAGARDCFDSTCCVEDLDRADPLAVVGIVFEAARTGQLMILGTLCDPVGENDGDTRRICGLATSPEGLEEFAAFFAPGQVAGDATIEEDHAEVPIRFGPDGSQTETMRLVLRDGRWYLMSF